MKTHAPLLGTPSHPTPRWLLRLHRQAGRRGLVPLTELGTSLDAFLPVLPSTSILIATVLLRPERWRSIALWFATGGAVGATLLAGVIGHYGRPLVERLLGDAIESARWAELEESVQAHGVLVLFVLAFAPWPVRTAVAVCALAQLPLLHIGIAVWVARLAGFSTLACLTARVPDYVTRLAPFRRLIEQGRATCGHANRR